MRTIAASAWTQSAIVVLLIGWAMRSFALPIDNGEGEGTPAQEHALACIEHATVSFTANPSQVSLGTPTMPNIRCAAWRLLAPHTLVQFTSTIAKLDNAFVRNPSWGGDATRAVWTGRDLPHEISWQHLR